MFGLSTVRLTVFFGLVLAVVVLASADAVLWSHLGAKDSKIEDLGNQLKVAAGDVVRWETAANQDQQVIRRQAEQIRRLESDGAAAAVIAAHQLADSTRRQARLQTQLDDVRRQAHDHPEDVRDLGPIVRGALGGLRREPVPAGADPGGT